MASGPGIRFSGFVIPESHLAWSFDPSGGPGGQHANRSSTRVTLELDITRCNALPEPTRHELIRHLGPRARAGVVTVTVDDTRSQWRNRSIARRRLATLLTDALAPRRARRATTPSRAARRRRAEAKKRRSETKRLRRPPDADY